MSPYWKRVASSILRVTVTAVFVVMVAQALSACPTCKDGMAQDPARINMVRGYFWSILFMMSMPFLIFGGLGYYFYREMKRLQSTLKSQGVTSAGRSSF